MQPKEPWCSKVPAESYSVICQLADDIGTTPETITAGLKIANIAAVDELYTASQADAFIAKIEGQIKAYRAFGGVTYQAFLNYALREYGNLPPKIQAIFEIAKEFYAIDAPELKMKVMSDYDWSGILEHLADQRRLLSPFLK